ncbi:MAG: hypothetical protein HYT61_01010 [Candidatus Yanofskybacteria bacterium]|nr:hypothetical protein [Candidatus Yanofskybacteria bacterium]
MSKAMTYSDTTKVVVAIATAMLLVVGLVYFIGVRNTFAVAPSDYGLKEGDTISAAGSDDPDVYIVNDWGYKRLFLNPAIFNLYGHLGGFAAVKSVSPATRDAFVTSGLFRVDGDEKVYGLETTGEDTAVLRWVNTSGAQAVADDPNFFKKVFIINAAEKALYTMGTDFTSVTQVPAYTRGGSVTPVATGPLTVSLSPSNPPAQTITINSYGMTVMALRFSGSGTVNELTLKRGGAGAVGDYDNLYVYDGVRRLTGGRSPSSSDGTVTFISLGVAVSGTKDLLIVADHSGVAGNVNNWTLTNVGASGTVSGYPLTSNNFQISGSNSGTLTVSKSGSVSNPKVGQKNAILSEFKIETATEASVLKRMQLLNGGSTKSADLTNLRLEVSGAKVADGYMSGDGYAVFDFGSGYTITKGDSKIFTMYGDVASKKDETIKFYLEYASDIYGWGDQYGQGMKATITAFDTSASTESHNLTLEGGVLTITFNGPSATNVSTTTTDSVLAKYTFTAAANIEVKKLGLVICWDNDGNGFNDAADTTNGVGDLEDIKITDEDSGQVIVGPADGSAFTTSEATGCPDSATGASKIFTDTFDLLAGKPRNFKVTADVKSANTNSSTATLGAADIIKVVLDGYGEADLATTAGDIGVMKYSGTSTAVDDSDISPNTDLSGNNMTLQASTLTLGLSSSPKSATSVKGTKDVEVVAFSFAASLASAIKVTDITLTGYVDDASVSFDVGVSSGSDANLSVGNLVSAVKLYDGNTGTLISATPYSNQLNNSTGTIKFNNLNWTIPAGQTNKLLVKADLSSNATSGSGTDYFTFDINATSDVTGIDDRSTTVNSGNADPNNAGAPTVFAGVANSGTIVAALAPANPITEAKYWGQTDTEFTRIRLRSTKEAFQVERLNFYNLTANTATASTNNIDKVRLTYTNKAGTTLTAVGSLNTSTLPSVSFGFTGDNRPYIPKDSSTDIIVRADMKTKAQGATSEVNFALSFSGGAADEFRAVGEGSGSLIEGNTGTSTIADLSGNSMYVYRVFPKVEQLTLAASEPLGTKDTLKFKITAMGLSDSKILFDDPTSTSLAFEVVASGGADQALWHYLYDMDTGELVASIQDTPDSIQLTPAQNASVTFDNWEKDVEIQGGQSKSFRIETAFQNLLDKSDYYQLILRDDASVIKYVDGARSNEDQEITNTAGVFKLLPMNGPIFVKQ